MRISSIFVDFCLSYVSVFQGSQEEVVNMSWVDWCGKMLKDRKVFLSVLGLNSQTMGLLVQVHNYSATTHTPLVMLS